MENRAHAFAAGLFALLLGAGVVFAVWWFSQEREATREIVLVARGDINGLAEQSRVRFRGLAVGNVRSIHIDPDDPGNLLIHAWVRSDVPVTRGTSASLGTMGVTGLAFVQLDDRGDDPRPLGDGEAARIPLRPGLVDVLGERALAALAQLNVLGERIAALLDDENSARLRNTLARLESAATGLDAGVAELPATLAALRRLLGEENLDHLSSLLARADRAAGDVPPMLTDLRRLLQRLEVVAGHLDEAATQTADGLAGETLPQLNTLLRELVGTSHRLGRFAEELEASPQILLTGRRAGEPGPGEPGFEGSTQ